MAIGASLWGLTNFSSETGSGLTKPGKIGCQYGYVNLTLVPGQPRVRQGARLGPARRRLAERDHGQHARQTLLRRDRATTSRGNQYNQINPYIRAAISTPRTSSTTRTTSSTPRMAGIGDGHNGGGPIWAIFDADAVAREKWNPSRRTSISPLGSSSRRTRSPNSPGRS